MGIKGLHTALDGRLRPQRREKLRAGSQNIVVCDGLCLVRTFYPPHVDWVRGGQWEEGSPHSTADWHRNNND